MKKKKYSLVFLLLLPFIVGWFAPIDAAEDSMVEIILHKRIVRDTTQNERPLEVHQNDGKEIPESEWETTDVISRATPLNGAIFEVYDITDYYRKQKATGESFIEQISEMPRKEINDLIADEQLAQVPGSPITTKKDEGGSDNFGQGIARIRVPKKQGEGYAAYLIFERTIDPEKGLNVDIDTKAIPIVVLLPLMDPADPSKSMDQIHIYPKNVGYVRDPYFFKYGRTSASDASPVPLEGAKFVLYQLNEQGEKLYLDMAPVNDLKNKWIKDEKNDPLANAQINKFVSDKEGLVNTGERFLPSGTYYFEEVESAEGYEITPESQKIEVIIPESWEDEQGNPTPVMINGQPMEELVSGKVPESAKQSATPRVYNLRKKVTEKESGVSEEEKENGLGGKRPGKIQSLSILKDSLGGKVFPQTGEAKSFMAILGALLVFGSLTYIYKKQNENKEERGGNQNEE